MKKPRMLLFDYGGTLIDELDFSPSTGNKSIYPYITENPYNVSAEALDSYIQTLFEKIRGMRSEQIEIHEHIFLRYVLEYWNLKLSISIEEAEELMFNSMSTTQKTPESAEMLTFLRREGIRTGVISNLCWSGKVLAHRLHKNFAGHDFEFIITTSEYVFRKPEKHIFDIAVRKSGLFPVFYDNAGMPEAVRQKNNTIALDFPHLKISLA